MADQTVITYLPNGPEGVELSLWEPIPPESLVSGEPVQHGHEYFQTADGALTSGVWDCTAFETVLEPYSVNEYMLLLEGEVTIIDASGDQRTFRAGDSFVIPKGLNCRWKQTGYVRKFYVIFDDPSGASAAHPESLESILVNPELALDSMENLNEVDFVGPLPTMAIRNFYQDPTGQFDVGVWHSTAMTRVAGTIARSEFMHILQGSGEIINADGVRYEFGPGSTFLVPIGMGYQWDSKESVKKIFCSFSPG